MSYAGGLLKTSEDCATEGKIWTKENHALLEKLIGGIMETMTFRKEFSFPISPRSYVKIEFHLDGPCSECLGKMEAQLVLEGVQQFLSALTGGEYP